MRGLPQRPLVRVTKLTEVQEITPYKWLRPEEERSEACRFMPAGSIIFQRNVSSRDKWS
jgi:hypothetical protein